LFETELAADDRLSGGVREFGCFDVVADLSGPPSGDLGDSLDGPVVERRQLCVTTRFIESAEVLTSDVLGECQCELVGIGVT
jgi:hypothetical protein